MDRFDKKTALAAAAWGGLTVYVVGVDAALIASGNATLSEVFEASMKHPIKRYPVVAAWAIITAHLFCPRDVVAKKFDPIHQIANLFRQTV